MPVGGGTAGLKRLLPTHATRTRYKVPFVSNLGVTVEEFPKSSTPARHTPTDQASLFLESIRFRIGRPSGLKRQRCLQALAGNAEAVSVVHKGRDENRSPAGHSGQAITALVGKGRALDQPNSPRAFALRKISSATM